MIFVQSSRDFDNSLLSTMENTFTVHVKIHPNPTGGNIVISFDKQTSGDIKVYTLSGKLLQSTKIKDQYQSAVYLDAGQGTYLVKIITDSGENYVEKIVVTK